MTHDPAAFEAARPRLIAIAYGLLADRGEAEDVVQDAWLRLQRTSLAPGSDVTGWLVVTVGRLALDVVRSARRRREEYVGPWLPEPVVADDPADRVTLDESVSLALLVVLEALTPAERAAFVLHDVFGMPFDEVAAVVGRTPAAVRRLASRARAHLRERAPRFDADPTEHRRVVAAFAAAVDGRDLAALTALLDPDVVLRSDGGGVVRAARRPVLGAERVSRFVIGVAAKGPGTRHLVVTVNGQAGLLRVGPEGLRAVTALGVTAGRITTIDVVLHPDKIRRAARFVTEEDQTWNPA